MSKVFVKKSSYDYSELKPAVDAILDNTIGNIGLTGKRVLIKPNLLRPARPEQAILTHPMVIKAVAQHVLGRGGRPVVSDSNAMGAFDKVAQQNGIKDALKGLDVELQPLQNPRIVETGDPVIKTIELSADALDADVIINLPKLKTHSQMLLTLGVKNLFGCIVGLRKTEWHLRMGIDRELFGRLLVLVYRAVNPTVTLLDGVLSMEGNGPGTGGKPRRLDVLMGSTDTPALDAAVCIMLGVRHDGLLTNSIARPGKTFDDIEIIGSLPRVKHFKLPGIRKLVFGPRFASGFIRRHLTQRPAADDDECRLCGECRQFCPARAITQGKSRITFDYDKCIRCYCCLEACPHGALKIRTPFIHRVVRNLKI